MKLSKMFDQSKAVTKFIVERFRIVEDNIQAAAFGRTLWPKRRNHYVPPRLYGMRNLTHISRAVTWVRKKMKHGSVVPEIIFIAGECESSYVSVKPIHGARTVAKTPLGYVKRDGRKVQNRQIAVPAIQQIIDKRRFATTDVDYFRVSIWNRFIDELERYVQVRPIPTNLVRLLCPIYRFPVRSRVH
jgi:hypothetical protein